MSVLSYTVLTRFAWQEEDLLSMGVKRLNFSFYWESGSTMNERWDNGTDVMIKAILKHANPEGWNPRSIGLF